MGIPRLAVKRMVLDSTHPTPYESAVLALTMAVSRFPYLLLLAELAQTPRQTQA